MRKALASCFTAAAAPLLLGVLLGCRSTPPPPAQAVAAQPAPQQQQAAQAPAPSPTHRQPLQASSAEPQIDDQTEAAVRGSQTIDFAVSAAGKPLQSATLTVRTTHGKLAARGTTDDWGEFHTSLTQGVYKVVIAHQGTKFIRIARITPDTQEIDLQLEPAPNP